MVYYNFQQHKQFLVMDCNAYIPFADTVGLFVFSDEYLIAKSQQFPIFIVIQNICTVSKADGTPVHEIKDGWRRDCSCCIMHQTSTMQRALFNRSSKRKTLDDICI